MKTKSFALPSLLVLIAVLGFQNCSNMNLEEIPIEELSEAASLEIKANYCPDSRTIPGEAAKYIFVVDMSASNIGDWDTDPAIGSQIPPSYWNPTVATDFNGSRFQAVKKFLETCGSQTGAQFAVVGFSNTAGTITGSGATQSLSCTNTGFGDSLKALSDLDALAKAQEAEKPWFLQWKRSEGRYLTDSNFPPILGATSYRLALGCTESIVVNDLTKSGPNPTDRYHVFFISDGTPVDPKSINGCNQPTWTAEQKYACHMKAVIDSSSFMRQAAFAKGKDLRIHAIYYGRNTIPDHMDALAKDGGTGGTMQLASFEKEPNVLCSLVLGQSSVELRPDSLAAINLTSIRKNGILQADSDMDGLTDKEELKLGYKPSNPRSAVDGVLDGICERLGGYEACMNKRNTISCNPSVLNSTGLSECDIKMLGLNNFKSVPDWGIDSDGDGILDFIEILKGTDPSRSDQGTDPDSDGIITREEIIRGTDPFRPDSDIPENLLNNTSIEYSALDEDTGCEYGHWGARVSRVQSVGNLSVSQMPANISALNHSENEEVLLFFYRLTPQNASKPISEFYWGLSRVRVEPHKYRPKTKFVSDPIVSKPDFVKLGEVEL